jgi:hypothetical protein
MCSLSKKIAAVYHCYICLSNILNLWLMYHILILLLSFILCLVLCFSLYFGLFYLCVGVFFFSWFDWLCCCTFSPLCHFLCISALVGIMNILGFCFNIRNVLFCSWNSFNDLYSYFFIWVFQIFNALFDFLKPNGGKCIGVVLWFCKM